MSEELSFFETAHRPSISSASSTVPSAASPLSADSSTPPEYLFQDYASPIAASFQSYPRLHDDDHLLLPYHIATPPHHTRPRPSPLLLPHHSHHALQLASPTGTEPSSAVSAADHASRLGSQPLSASATPDGAPVKRPRGRPRKHPLIVPSTIPKGQKGARSKTGCGTCRRRKKKCDETKPICLNCQKNGVQCEGYRPVETWKSGVDAKGNKHAPVSSPLATPTRLSAPPLPSNLPGVENELDQQILDHFNSSACQTFAPWSTRPMAFRDLFMPLAVHDQSVMHSLLALSGSHLHNQQPVAELKERIQHHQQEALQAMNQDMAAGNHVCDANRAADPILAARAILLCLKSGVTGDTSPTTNGYRIHWDAIAHMALKCPSKPADAQFRAFINDFAAFHGICQTVTTLSRPNAHPATFQLPTFVSPEAGSFLGAFDGVFMLLSKVANLRNRIRQRRLQQMTPEMNAYDLAQAQGLEVELDEWVCNQSEDSPQWTTGHLYRVCASIFLTRTVSRSESTPILSRRVEKGLAYLAQLMREQLTQGVLLMPLFLLGCAAFEPGLRPEVSAAFETLRKLRGSENISRARDVVCTIWELMDAGDPASWDWEMVMTDMGWDFFW